MGEAPAPSCNVEPGRRVRWRGLLGRRRRKLPVVRLGGASGGRAGRGILRRLKLRWLTARWLRRAARRLAAIYLAALTGPPGGAASTCPPWLGLDPCFATPFVATARPCCW
ncbi:hypothetical protein HU200_038893 [Digitaria exilis]|uniref:Uncharacterized protein n=1 Tax=Digitaria exilis TaxID=1010633 RepID=A0A835EHZ0_9POAL|nr:hypothetical protein HU200_038893 [Digitaria exilis]